MSKKVIGHLILCCIFVLAGCAAIRQEQPRNPSEPFEDEFIIVRASQWDTIPYLAEIFLHDRSKDWMIRECNGLEQSEPGQGLAIPMKPFAFGGLTAEGYQTVPILSYHKFSKDRSDKLTVTEAAFKAQMEYLRKNDYRVISAEQFIAFLDFKDQIPKKSVVITADDGWDSFYDIAFPILKEYGFPATLFIYTDFIGTNHAVSWEQLEIMSKQGLDIQCKSKSHRNLAVLKKNESPKAYREEVEKEISFPTQLIAEKLGKKCSLFAYPYGESNSFIAETLKKYGYRAGFTLTGGDNPFFVGNYMIHRYPIYGQHELEEFKNNLAVFREENLK
jgi:peptidoglycan/xylan/chitin deacetylase (PgdA/CDA1 family)